MSHLITLLGSSVWDVQVYLKSNSNISRKELRLALHAEQAGKNRTTIVKLLQARLRTPEPKKK